MIPTMVTVEDFFDLWREKQLAGEAISLEGHREMHEEYHLGSDKKSIVPGRTHYKVTAQGYEMVYDAAGDYIRLRSVNPA